MGRIGFYGYFTEFYGRYTGLWTGISLQTQNTVVSFVCLASSLYSDLPIALTIMHFDGTPIHSLHNSHPASTKSGR